MPVATQSPPPHHREVGAGLLQVERHLLHDAAVVAAVAELQLLHEQRLMPCSRMPRMSFSDFSSR